MKILLVSDIHAMSKDIESLSQDVNALKNIAKADCDGFGHNGYFGSTGGIFKVEDRSHRKNPILNIADDPDLQEMNFDLMLCLGDITHQAKQGAFLVAWNDLNTIVDNLNIPNFISIVGNHDVQSRAGSVEEAESCRDFLQNLSPCFPYKPDVFNSYYFAYGFASLEIGECLVVAIDTCRTHGLGANKQISRSIFSKGSLSDRVIEMVVNVVQESSLKHVVVAMHHHPLRLEGDEADDHIPKGEEFLLALERTKKNILVLHGHKHLVQIRPFSSAACSPFVFSSASLCAYPLAKETTRFSNQFHAIDFDTSIDSHPMGTIYSWDRGATSWAKSTRPHMPYEVHFGGSFNLDDIEKKLISLPQKNLYGREELIDAIPSLKYLKIKDFDLLNQLLESRQMTLVIESGKLIGLIYEELRNGY